MGGHVYDEIPTRGVGTRRYLPKGGVVLKRTKKTSKTKKWWYEGGWTKSASSERAKRGLKVYQSKRERQPELFGRQWLLLWLLFLSKRLIFELLCEMSMDCGMAGVVRGWDTRYIGDCAR